MTPSGKVKKYVHSQRHRASVEAWKARSAEDDA